MSQAHYVLCDHVGNHIGTVTPSAVAEVRAPWGRPFLLCRECLNEVLDECDSKPHMEPTSITWTWGPDERACPLHHWSDVLCSDWSTEHAAMIRGLFRAPTEGASP
jgi:hypothetical protein